MYQWKTALTISLYWPARWTIFRQLFEGKLALIVFLCCFLSYQICSYVSMWTVPKACPFVAKGKASKLVSHRMWWAHTMVRWRQLDGTSTISSGPVRQGVALFALEEEDAKMGRIPIRKVGQRESRLSSHILCSALASSSWSAGVVAGVADLEDDAMM